MARKRRPRVWVYKPGPFAVTPESAAPLYEVIREHETTRRVQLHAWGYATEEAAELDARLLNGLAAMDGGRTLATSGHRETGWVYRVRAPGGRR